MIWLTWRQFRGAATMMSAALAVLAGIVILTDPGLADDYSAGIAACTAQGRGCSDFVRQFFNDNQGPFLAVNPVVLVLPARIGLFWGAPLISRELEAGTHFWPFQWIESGIYTVLAAGLAGLCFWRLRHRLS
jgi:hypothetical protein